MPEVKNHPVRQSTNAALSHVICGITIALDCFLSLQDEGSWKEPDPKGLNKVSPRRM